MVRLLPHSDPPPACRRGLARLLLVVLALLAGQGPRFASAQEAELSKRPVTIRVTWGGGQAHAWSGSIRLVPAEGEATIAEDLQWQTLCGDADAAATAHAVGDTIFVHEPSRRGGNGVELVIPRWRRARLAVRLYADGDERTATTFETAIADLVLDAKQQVLDRDGNRLTLKAAPGDGLRVEVMAQAAPAANSGGMSALFRPGGSFAW
jgi:hypothetical protein